MEILIRETTAWQYVIYLFAHYSVSNLFSMSIGLNLASFPKRWMSGVMMLAYIWPLIAQKLTTNCFAHNLNTWNTSFFFCEDELNTAYKELGSLPVVFGSPCVLLCVVLEPPLLPGGANESGWQLVFNGVHTPRGQRVFIWRRPCRTCVTTWNDQRSLEYAVDSAVRSGAAIGKRSDAAGVPLSSLSLQGHWWLMTSGATFWRTTLRRQQVTRKLYPQVSFRR